MFESGGGLIAVKGFYTSVRTSNARLLVNINVANAAFYSAINLNNLMTQHTSKPSAYLKSGLEQFITNLKASHTFNGKKTVKTVKGFSYPLQDDKHDQPRMGNASTIRFRWEEVGGQELTTVCDYFKYSTLDAFHSPFLNFSTNKCCRVQLEPRPS